MHCRRFCCRCLLLRLHSLLCQYRLFQFVLVFLFSLIVFSFSGSSGICIVDDVFRVGSWRTEVLVGQNLAEDGFSLKDSLCCWLMGLIWTDLTESGLQKLIYLVLKPLIKESFFLLPVWWHFRDSGRHLAQSTCIRWVEGRDLRSPVPNHQWCWSRGTRGQKDNFLLKRQVH